jgi:uncharacterized protein (DUF433 family)
MNDSGANGFLEPDRIVVDPRIMVGKPVVRGTRVPVSLILNLIAHGYSFQRIVEEYPVLTDADIRAAILYASDVLDHREVRELVPSP